MKVFIYGRYNRGNEDFSESVYSQIINCQKLAVKRKLEVVGIFKDLDARGESYPVGAEEIARLDKAYTAWAQKQSKKINFRLGLSQMLHKLDEVDYIIVDDLSRLYQNITGSFLEGYINQFIKESNVKIIQVKGSAIDLDELDPNLISMLKNQIRNEDSQRKSENSINAFRQKRDSGRLCGDAKMHGIRYIGDGKLEVIPEWIEIIKFIFDNICEHRSYRAIIKDCNERWGSMRFFYESSIYRIARQPIYCGYQYNSNVELIKNIQIQGQEIITPEQWHEVQEIMAQKRAKYHARDHKHWLPISSKIHCGACGSKLICLIEHGKIYYICNRRTLDRSHADCRNSRIRFESGAHGEPSLYDAIYPLLIMALMERSRRLTEIVKERKALEKYDNELKDLAEYEDTLCNDFSLESMEDKEIQHALKLNQNRRNVILKRVIKLKNSIYKDEQLEDYQPEVLNDIFNSLVLKSLDNTTYETLLEDAQIKLTSFERHVEFDSVYGKFTIPRYRIRNRNWMPKWRVLLENPINQKGTVFTGKSKIKIIYETGTDSVIADFGNLQILSH